MKPNEYVRRRAGLTLDECKLLDHITRVGKEVEQVSKWCYYNANWAKRAIARGEKVA